jgi:hypothetical protein
LLTTLVAACAFGRDRAFAQAPAKSALDRAVAFLAVEVPKWHGENRCFSCHNNGDAVRALVQATATGRLKDRQPLTETLAFLNKPDAWDANGPDGPFKDPKLQRIQFAAALVAAGRAGLIADRASLNVAAALVAELQEADGHWQTDAPGTVGSPVTYGPALATLLASEALAAADPARYRKALASSRTWFEQSEPKSVLDAAATLWALAGKSGAAAAARRTQCLTLLERGRSTDGGWGPFANSPPEVFDTAVVTLALAAQPAGALSPGAVSPTTAPRDWLSGGRAFLLAAQETDGGWPATTRPPGVDSYAQRISTSGWALMALLSTK